MLFVGMIFELALKNLALNNFEFVIPARAGIQEFQPLAACSLPAFAGTSFAGMTLIRASLIGLLTQPGGIAMISRICALLSALALALGLTACATSTTQSGEAEVRQGVIEQITPVQINSSHHPGVGAVVGGIAGVGLGSLIGGGTGRDVAMVLGAVGGAVAGNQVQKKYDQPVAGLQIVVRLANGVLVSVTQTGNSGLRQGQNVLIQGSGEDARVVPR
jgi:outer membrane lipoprotein SlyB